MQGDAGIWRARLALRWLIAGEGRAHPARALVTVIAIAVGVALGFAVHLVNASALSSFRGAIAGVNGAADLQVRAATPLGFDERLYPRVALAVGVADASPVVRLDARAGGVRLTLLGLDVLRAARVTPSLVGALPAGPDQAGEALLSPDRIFCSHALLAALGLRVGSMLPIAANGRLATFRVAGTLPGQSADAHVATIDIAAAQDRFARGGRLDRLDLKTVDRSAAEASLARLLPPDAQIVSGEAEQAQGDALSRAYRVNLDMLALVALLTGGFLVFSAQSLSVTRRLRQFALLRTLGLPRRGVIAAVVIEGAVIGLAGASLGLFAGYAIAAGTLHYMGGDLGAGYFAGATSLPRFQAPAAIGFFLLGLATAMLGSFLPARVAAGAAPAAALKNAGDVIDPRRPVPWLPALLLLLAGGSAAALPAIGGLPWFGYASMALLLAGGVAAMPWFARQLLRDAARRGGRHAVPMLAVRHLAGAPSEAATALCGLVASTALTVAMATMVTSFRGAVGQWLDQVLVADLFVRLEGGGLSPPEQASLRATAGIRSIAFSRQLPLTIRADRPPVMLIARDVRPGSDPSLVLLARAPARPGGLPPAWVSEPAARLYGWRPGTIIRLPLGSGARFLVAGVWRDYARQSGAVVIGSDSYDILIGDARRDEAAVMLRPNVDPDSATRSLLARLQPTVRDQAEISRPRALKVYALRLFDRSFAVTYALEAVAILVGLAGVAATMAGQTIARSREFGMLRHLGLAKRQIIAMLAIEGALLGAIGSVAGIGLGILLAQVLIHVINPQSFNWTMSTILPGRTIAILAAALIASSALAAVIAGRRATARAALLAVREDW